MTHEVWQSPYFSDASHRLPFKEAENAIEFAGQKLLQDWDNLLKIGIGQVMLVAHETNQTQDVNLSKDGKRVASYSVVYLGVAKSSLDEPVDMFHLVNQNLEKTISVMKVAVIQDGSNRYKNVAALFFYSTGDIPKEQFYFMGKKLFMAHQVTKPQILFPNSPNPYDNQFLSVAYTNPQDDLPCLKVSAGFEGDEENGFWYKNFGGELVRNNGVRILEGEAQVVAVSQTGEVYNSKPFKISKAVTNMTISKPATAA